MYLFKWIAGTGVVLGLIDWIAVTQGTEGLFLASIVVTVGAIFVLVSVALSMATAPKRRHP